MNCFLIKRLWPFEDTLDVVYGPLTRHYFCRSDGMFRYHKKLNVTKYSIDPENSTVIQNHDMIQHNSKIKFKADVI